MHNLLSDAELVARLKYRQKHSPTETAKAFGIKTAALRSSLTEAKARGLTAKTGIKDETATLRTKVKLLERELESIQKHNEEAAAIRKEIYGLAQMSPEPPKWIKKPNGKGLSGVPVTIWSDWHWGEFVNPAEVGGVNSFNRKIAKQRLKLLVDSTIDLCFNHMTQPNYPGIVICLGGDMITGNIHEELQDTNDGYVQQTLLELQEQLISALTLIADKFGSVFVPCVVGNHGRISHKARMKGRVYDSYEWNLYCQLERHFRNDKRLQFLVPEETDAYFTVLGHRFLLTHGDTLGVKGGDGIIGCLGPVARGAFKVGRSESQIGRDFDTMLIGHWHTYVPRGDSIPVIVNGTLKGYDEYARLGMRVPYTRPSQALWFVHEKYGITAQWQIYLDKLRKTDNEWLRFQKRIDK